jgi:hypothetical protein
MCPHYRQTLNIRGVINAAILPVSAEVAEQLPRSNNKIVQELWFPNNFRLKTAVEDAYEDRMCYRNQKT